MVDDNIKLLTCDKSKSQSWALVSDSENDMTDFLAWFKIESCTRNWLGFCWFGKRCFRVESETKSQSNNLLGTTLNLYIIYR